MPFIQKIIKLVSKISQNLRLNCICLMTSVSKPQKYCRKSALDSKIFYSAASSIYKVINWETPESIVSNKCTSTMACNPNRPFGRLCSELGVSDVIFPGLFDFPENREFSGIQSNFPGILGNPLKAAFSPDLQGVIS